MQEVEAEVVLLGMVELLDLEDLEVVVMVVKHNKQMDNQEPQILEEVVEEEMITVQVVVQEEKV